MSDSIEINERDIYNFVFYPHAVEEIKKSKLVKGKNFQEEINFYKFLKDNYSPELDPAIKNILKLKIPVYKVFKVIQLKPVKENDFKRQAEVTIFAAASPNERYKIVSKTFFDEQNDYLIRLLNFEHSTKIYVFSISNNILRNYKVVLHPSGKIFTQPDNTKPIEIDSQIEADSIELQFEN